MITRIAHKYLDYRYKEIDSFINKPIETQEKILEYLLRNGEQTFFVQQFNFSAIKNKDDFDKNKDDLIRTLNDFIKNKDDSKRLPEKMTDFHNKLANYFNINDL